ncbi:hypothetical protein [Ferirhizobium litorale]|nr:hypothetical protein [Fererhizobium litorale]
MSDTIVLIHGAWLNSRSWAAWRGGGKAGAMPSSVRPAVHAG